MRIKLFLVFLVLLMALIIWVNLNGFFSVVGWALFCIFLVIAIGYPDTALLFFLGAREARSSNEEHYYRAASHEAYKLLVPIPNLYYYNGNFERSFVFQRGDKVSLVLSKSLIQKLSTQELSAICFELLLQVKTSMAPKRTRVMFLIGVISWAVHSVLALFLEFVPFKEFQRACNWFVIYFLNPVLDLLFSLILGTSYFHRLKKSMQDYPKETEELKKVHLRLRDSSLIKSLPSKKLLEFTTASKKANYKNILALEFLPHEWSVNLQEEKLINATEA